MDPRGVEGTDEFSSHSDIQGFRRTIVGLKVDY